MPSPETPVWRHSRMFAALVAILSPIALVAMAITWRVFEGEAAVAKSPMHLCNVPSTSLPPLDSRGAKLETGDVVLIASIPKWVFDLAPPEAVGTIKTNVGRELRITAFEAEGMIDLAFPEDADVTFCLRPDEVRRK
jgi:hypothetical protein